MASDRTPGGLLKLEVEGEGIYASALSSDTRDPTDQGLTLSPKIQLNDPSLFNAAVSFQDQDLDDLLGPLDFDMIAEAQKRSFGVDSVANCEYQCYEPLAKRRKITAALSQAIYPPLGLNEPDCQSETPSLSPSAPTQALSPLHLEALDQQQDHPISEASIVSRVVCLPHTIIHPPLPNFGGPGLSVASPLRPSARIGVDLPPIALPIASATQIEHQDGDKHEHENIEVLRDEEVEIQISDCVEDDGSLFGDDLSNQETFLECCSTDKPSWADQDAELAAELEVQLDAEFEAECQSTQLTTQPMIAHPALPEVGSSAANPFSTTSSAASDAGLNSLDSSWYFPSYLQAECRGNPFSTGPPPLELSRGPHAYWSHPSPILPVFESVSPAPHYLPAPPVDWDSNIPLPSVENGSFRVAKDINHMSTQARHTFIRPSSVKARLSVIEKKLARVSSRRSPRKLPDQSSDRASVSEEAQPQINKSSASQCSPAPLPYLLALSLASGQSKSAIEESYRTLQDQKLEKQPLDKPNPPSSVQIPPQLRILLDSLHAKFTYDLHFRKSALTWALDKASSQETQCCDSACELTQLKEELEQIKTERDKYQALAEELKDVAIELL